MSLVGTRPPTVDEWDKYELHHRARLATKPGLTGMWQVSGRSNITDLQFDSKTVSFQKVKDMMGNGIWTSLNQLGNVLNSGLDILLMHLICFLINMR